MFGGFQIVGTGTRKVFVRGRGPSLIAAGVPNTLVDPQIAVFKYQNDPNDDFLGIYPLSWQRMTITPLMQTAVQC